MIRKTIEARKPPSSCIIFQKLLIYMILGIPSYLAFHMSLHLTTKPPPRPLRSTEKHCPYPDFIQSFSILLEVDKVLIKNRKSGLRSLRRSFKTRTVREFPQSSTVPTQAIHLSWLACLAIVAKNSGEDFV